MGALGFEELESEFWEEGGREVEERVGEVVGFPANTEEEKVRRG